jgi:hypothetical protein
MFISIYLDADIGLSQKFIFEATVRVDFDNVRERHITSHVDVTLAQTAYIADIQYNNSLGRNNDIFRPEKYRTCEKTHFNLFIGK